MAPANWGIAATKANRSAWSMSRFGKLLDLYRPAVVVLEKNPESANKNLDRVQLLAKTMGGVASGRDIALHVYKRTEIARAITANESAKRGDVARAVALLFPILRDRLPSPRKPWQTEDNRRSLFDAAAIGVAHYKLTGRET
jgi:Holliday junction resolvasome RuvABC endonuclease subunit